MAAPECHADPTQPPQLDLDAVSVDGTNRHGRRHGQRSRHSPTSALDDIQRGAPGACYGQVAPYDDGGLLPGDRLHSGSEPVRVIERDVGHDGYSAIPGVGRVEPAAQPDFDDRQIDADFGEPEERDGGQDLELGRVAVAAGHDVGFCQDPAHQSREGVGFNGLAANPKPLAIGDQMGLGRFADPIPGRGQCGAHERQHAALAVRAGDQGAAERSLGMIEPGQECTCASQPQVNAESPAGLERGERLSVGEQVLRQSFVRSSS